MLRITHVSETPFHSISYLTAGRRGKPIREKLEFFRAEASGLPKNLRSLLLTSDLQGRETGKGNQLLGCALAKEIESLQNQGIITKPDMTIVCGDLYEYPDCRKRGGTGAVDQVFRSLATVCEQVIGVLGNHDQLEAPASSLGPNITILDGNTKKLLSLSIAGISGIIGDPKKNLRRDEEAFISRLRSLTAKSPDLLLLHQGPDDPQNSRRGDPAVRMTLENGYTGLTIFGHTRWNGPPLVTLGSGQGLNVDGKVILLVQN